MVDRAFKIDLKMALSNTGVRKELLCLERFWEIFNKDALRVWNKSAVYSLFVFCRFRKPIVGLYANKVTAVDLMITK